MRLDVHSIPRRYARTRVSYNYWLTLPHYPRPLLYRIEDEYWFAFERPWNRNRRPKLRRKG